MTGVALSCCIITKNEEDRIGRCLAAVKGLADEIIVVDSGSTDRTLEIASEFGARVISRGWEGYGQQKRHAEDAASFDWILNLDADEVVSPALSEEIRALLKSEPQFAGYRVLMPEVFPGHDRPRLWAEAHNYIRLYDRRRMRFKDSAVHDTVDAAGQPVGQLVHPAYHFSNRSIAHLRAKMDSYMLLQSKSLKKSRSVILARLPFEYIFVFLKYYLARRNFTGGLFGFQASHIAATMRVKRLMRMLAAG